MTDRANRILWTFVAVLLLVVGGCGTLMSMGYLDSVPGGRALLSESMVADWHRADGWNLWALITAGLLVALCGWWLLRAQFRRRGQPRMGDMSALSTKGRTVIRAAGLEKALRADIVSAPAVVNATVTLTGRHDRPQAWIRIDLAGGVTLDKAHRHVTEALERFAVTSGVTPVAVDVTVRPVAERSRVS